MFYEAASSIIGILSNIHRVSYISVVRHMRGRPLQVQSRDFYNARFNMEKGSLYDDDYLNQLFSGLENLQPGEDKTFFWPGTPAENAVKAQRLSQHELYNGYSLLFRHKEETIWCISVFSNEDEDKMHFHERFLSKREKIKKILNAYGFD